MPGINFVLWDTGLLLQTVLGLGLGLSCLFLGLLLLNCLLWPTLPALKEIQCRERRDALTLRSFLLVNPPLRLLNVSSLGIVSVGVLLLAHKKKVID